MTNGEHERRITTLEADVKEMDKCFTRLETNQLHITKHSDKLERAMFGIEGNSGMVKEVGGIASSQDDIVTKLDAMHKTINGGKEVEGTVLETGGTVTFKWLLEKIFLPLLIGIVSVAVSIFAVVQYFMSQGVAP